MNAPGIYTEAQKLGGQCPNLTAKMRVHAHMSTPSIALLLSDGMGAEYREVYGSGIRIPARNAPVDLSEPH
jgi:hypothetical protein